MTDLDQADREAQDALHKWLKSPHDGYKGKRHHKAVLAVADRMRVELAEKDSVDPRGAQK